MGEVTANAIEERLIDFAVRIIKLADALPETLAGKHIARQLLRSGTSLVDENQQLCRILNASITTSKRNQNDK